MIEYFFGNFICSENIKNTIRRSRYLSKPNNLATLNETHPKIMQCMFDFITIINYTIEQEIFLLNNVYVKIDTNTLLSRPAKKGKQHENMEDSIGKL